MGSSGSAPGCEGCSCGSRLARCTMMMSAVEQWPPPLPPAVSPVLPAGEVEEGLEEQLRRSTAAAAAAAAAAMVASLQAGAGLTS